MPASQQSGAVQIVPEGNDQSKFIVIAYGLPMLDAGIANHPVIRNTERVGLRIRDVETRDVYFHQHPLQRQRRGIYNGTGSLCCIIAGPFPFALRCPFRLGAAGEGSCATTASFPVEKHRRISFAELVVKPEKLCIRGFGVCCGILSLSL
jgi:hypothetical protein